MIRRELDGSDVHAPLGQLILTLEAQLFAMFIVIQRQRHNTAVLTLMLQQVRPQHVLYLRER